MPNKVVPTFFKKSVSFTSSAVLEDVLTESITLSVTPVMTNRQYVNSQVSMPLKTSLEDTLSEAITLSFRPTVKIMEPAANANVVTTTASTGYYWYQS